MAPAPQLINATLYLLLLAKVTKLILVLHFKNLQILSTLCIRRIVKKYKPRLEVSTRLSEAASELLLY